MRIAYVINSVEGGGAALPVPAVASALRARGANIRLFALTRRDGRALPAMAAVGLDAQVRAGGEGDHAAALAWLNGELGRWRPDVIWTSLTRATLIGQVVGLWRQVPVVSWQHAAYLKPANLALLRRMRARSALWIADSTSVAQLTADRLRIDRARLAIWPLFAMDPLAPQARPWQPGETLRLGTLGRLHPVKGHDVLIAALARLRAGGFVPPVPMTVDVAGEGAERERLVAQAAAAGVGDLRLPGYTEDPREFLAGLHLYLQPSRSEGLCIAAHEAMQAGLPVIGSAVGEIPHSIVDGVTGLVVPPGDATLLALAIRRLVERPDRLAAMGAAGRARLIERFGAEAFATACDEVFARLPRPGRA